MDSRAWDERYASAPELVWTAEPNRFVVEEVAGLSPGRAIDLAAGEGRNAVWLAQQGWEVTAVDFSPVAIERGRELARQRNVTVDWHVADVTTYTPPADGFDLVLIAYLHLPAAEIAVVLSHARDAVRAGGIVLVVGHDLANLCGTGRLQEHPVLPTPQPVVDGSKGRGSAGPEPPPAGNRRCRTVEARRTSRT